MVIRQAAAQAAKIRRLGLSAFRVSVSLFASQLRSGRLAEIVSEALEENALSPDALELEITETIFLEQDETIIRPAKNPARACERRPRRLRHGLCLAELLKSFPLSRLKIDRSFIRDVCFDAEDEAVVRTIVYLAHSFSLDVTAEGVEREEQRLRLRELGCESGQGYLFGRPIPAMRMLQLLEGDTPEGVARWSKSAFGFSHMRRA